jgi:hypothetical protein
MNGQLRIRCQEGALQLHASVDNFNFFYLILPRGNLFP